MLDAGVLTREFPGPPREAFLRVRVCFQKRSLRNQPRYFKMKISRNSKYFQQYKFFKTIPIKSTQSL